MPEGSLETTGVKESLEVKEEVVVVRRIVEVRRICSKKKLEAYDRMRKLPRRIIDGDEHLYTGDMGRRFDI